jgi:hypothetical protein
MTVCVADGEFTRLQQSLEAMALHEMLREEVGLCPSIEQTDGRCFIDLALEENGAALTVGVRGGTQVDGV